MNININKCAPSKNYSEGSCFTLDNLKSIAKSYNNNHKDKIPLINDKKILLKHLTNKMSSNYGCKDQKCWLKSKEILQLDSPIKRDIKYNTFRPNGPNKKYEWLSTTDINKVMKQYEMKHNDFLFLGALPYDFDELPYYNTQNLDFNELENTTYKIGAVINLDTHDKSGSHWVALFANLKKKSIYYFDSFGKKPGKKVNLFVRRILTYMYNKKNHSNLNINEFLKKYHSSDDYDVRYNKIQHQFKNSECGVYSMNFLIRLLGGKSFDDIVENITDDDAMNLCRGEYFSNYSK
jgi:hypothetical protein